MLDVRIQADKYVYNDSNKTQLTHEYRGIISGWEDERRSLGSLLITMFFSILQQTYLRYLKLKGGCCSSWLLSNKKSMTHFDQSERLLKGGYINSITHCSADVNKDWQMTKTYKYKLMIIKMKM